MLVFQSGGNGEWRSPPNATFGGTIPSLSILLNSLLAATSYSFRFVAVYSAKVIDDTTVCIIIDLITVFSFRTGLQLQGRLLPRSSIGQNQGLEK